MKYTALLFDPKTSEYIADYASDTIEGCWELVSRHPADSNFKIAVITKYSKMCYYTTAVVIEACKDFEMLKGMVSYQIQAWLNSPNNRDYIFKNVYGTRTDNFSLTEKEIAEQIKEGNFALVKVKFGEIVTSAFCSVRNDGEEVSIMPVAIIVTSEMYADISPIYADPLPDESKTIPGGSQRPTEQTAGAA